MQDISPKVNNWRRKYDDETEKVIVARYVNGERAGELAKEFGCERSAISKMAKRHGHAEYASKIKGGVRGINTEHLNPEIIRLHGEGLSQSKIGEMVGVSQNVVSRVLRQKGLRPNNPSNVKSGAASNFWKGGRTITTEGYIKVLSDYYPTMRNKQGYIPEHRLVMAQYMERPLYSWETVHHIDGNKQNNELDNLQLRIGKHGKHEAYKCMDCGSSRVEPTKLRGED